MLQSKKSLKFILVFLISIVPVFANALNINHIITLQKDGGGNLNLSYFAKRSEIKSMNNMIGNFPFTNEKITELFSNPALQVKGVTIAKDSKDSTFDRVTLTIFFKNVSALNSLKAFANFTVNMSSSDSGNVVTYLITPEFTKQNSVENLYVILKPESEILSTNGKIEDKRITWFRGSEFIKADKPFGFTATLKSEDKKSPGNTGGDGKSCGLFGMELPLLLLGGLVLTGRRRKNNP